MKTCYRCNKTKNLNEFYNNKSKKDGKCCECKDCRKEIRNKNNPPKWIGKKIEMLEVIGYSKEKKEYLCKCDCGNLTYVKTTNLNNNKTKSCGCYVKKDLQKSLEKTIYSRYLTSAKKRNVDFKLNYDEFKKISEKPCSYCGETSSIKKVHKKYPQFSYECNGVDRVNNDEGYTLENSIPCCSWCNYMKNNYNVKDFIEKINKIKEHCDNSILIKKRIKNVS